MDIKDTLGRLTKHDALAAIGLETRRSAMDYLWPAAGLFAAGIVVGAGLGLVFAPKSGRELRAAIGDQTASLRKKLGDGAASIQTKVAGAYGARDDDDRDLAFVDAEAVKS